MYDKFDRLQVALTNVLRTQLAMMGVRLEDRLEARLDKRIAERLEAQTEQLRNAVRVEARNGAIDAFELEFAGVDDDVDDEFLVDEDELPGR